MRISVLSVMVMGAHATLQNKFYPDTFWTICQTYVVANQAAINDCKNSGAASTSSSSGSNNHGKSVLEARARGGSGVSSTCVCQLDNIVRSIYQCIETFSENSTDRNAIEHSWKKYRRNCLTQGSSLVYSLEEVQTAIAANPITQTYDEATKSGTGAFRLPDEDFSKANRLAGEDYYFQYTRNDYYGWASLIYVLGIMFIQMMINFINWVTPSISIALQNGVIGRFFRGYLSMPALFNGRAAQPYVFGHELISINVSTRLHALSVFGYVLLVTVLSCYNYPVTLAPSMQTSKLLYKTLYSGIRTGTMAMYTMALVYLFGGRNNFLIFLTGWNHEQFMIWHRWVARVFVLQSIAHSVTYGIYLVKAKKSISVLGNTFMIAGFVATCGGIVLCIQAIRYIRRLSYELFKTIHTLLGIAVLVGLYYHLRKTNVCFAQFWAPVGFWIIDRLSRVVKILIANPLKSRAVVTAIDDDILSIDISYSGLWKPSAGQYVYVHFLDWTHFYQNHPLTLIPVEGSPNQFRLVLKVMNGMSKSLIKKAHANGGTVGFRVLIDGPYGVSFNHALYKEFVLIAGGVGFTALCSQYFDIVSSSDDTQFIQLIWVVRHRNALSWFSKEIASMMTRKNVQLKIFITHTEPIDDQSNCSVLLSEKSLDDFSTVSLDSSKAVIENYKPNLTEQIETIAKESRGPVCVFTCGGHSLNDDVRRGCVKALNLTSNYVNFHEESFSF